MKFIIFLVLCNVGIVGFFYLSDPVAYEDDWMDAPFTRDAALDDPMSLVSNQTIPTAELSTPVCILVHGFSASSFEFKTFKEMVDVPDIRFSTVVMGGHGRNYDAFKVASYQDWVAPVIQEVRTLQEKGHTNISIFAVSAGASAVLHAVLNANITGINQLILMDPYIKPGQKIIHWVHLLGIIIKNNREKNANDLAAKHWYMNRPSSALVQLRALVHQVQGDLSTIDMSHHVLPAIDIFTAEFDPVAHTKGADRIQAAIPHAMIHRYSSHRHVLINKDTAENWSENDQHQLEAIVSTISQKLSKGIP